MRLKFRCTSVGVRLKDDRGENYAVAFIDGKMGEQFRLNAKDDLYPLATNLPEGEHTVELVRVTVCDTGLTHILDLS